MDTIKRWSELAGIKDEVKKGRKKGYIIKESMDEEVNEYPMEDDDNMELGDGEDDELDDLEGPDGSTDEAPVENDLDSDLDSDLDDIGDGEDELASTLSQDEKEEIISLTTKAVADALGIDIEIESTTDLNSGADLDMEGGEDLESDVDMEGGEDLESDLDMEGGEDLESDLDTEGESDEDLDLELPSLKKKGKILESSEVKSPGDEYPEKQTLKKLLAPLGNDVMESIFDAIWGEEAMAHWQQVAESVAASKESGEGQGEEDNVVDFPGMAAGDEEQMRQVAEGKRKVMTKQELLERLSQEVQAKLIMLSSPELRKKYQKNRK